MTAVMFLVSLFLVSSKQNFEVTFLPFIIVP